MFLENTQKRKLSVITHNERFKKKLMNEIIVNLLFILLRGMKPSEIILIPKDKKK